MFHFKLGPFPVAVYPWFFISAVLLGGRLDFGWQMFAWILVVFVGVLGHELGHALVGLALGGRPEIRLEAFGGVTFPRLTRRPSPARQFVLSAAGPAAGVALALLASALLRAFPAAPDSPSGLTVGLFIEVSFLWAKFNLLPVLPLDGGQMMLSLIEGVRRRPSVALASWISLVVIVAIAAWLLLSGNRQPFMFLFLALFAFQNFRQARAGSEAPPTAQAAAEESATERAEMLQASEDARAAVQRRDFDAALAAATRLEGQGGPYRQAAALRLRAGIELSRGDNESAAMLAGQSFSIWPNADAAVVAARANLRAGAQDRARNWVRRAVEAGAAPAAVRADPELSAIA